jgi:selenocysteine lyase/cysteine desulfurase
MEFPSNWTPWKRLEERGVAVRVADRPTLDAIVPHVDWRTRVVTVSSVAFHNGFVAELDAIGGFCAARDILFCVDAIQSVGVLPIDVRKSQISFLAADGHKWMCAPEGAALFYAAAERRELLRVIENGWTNIERHGKFIGCGTELLADARRFEAGSLNTNGIYGLRAAIDLLHEIGMGEISRRALAVAKLLAEGLESIGWRIESPKPIASPIVGATPPDVEKSVLWWHRKLEEANIVTAPREGMIRFSPHFYNDATEVERTIEVLRSVGVSEAQSRTVS